MNCESALNQLARRAEGSEGIRQAMAFCVAAHSAVGQVRKYTGEPYWEHPVIVAALVDLYDPDATDEMIIAALLHDVVEDTAITLEMIEGIFGPAVSILVEQLTDVSKPEDGNRAARKALDRRHTAQASAEAKTIKLADLISNTWSIVEHDSRFAAVYLSEKRALLEVLREGNQALWMAARELAYGNVNPLDMT